LVGERVIATSDPLNADPSSAGFSGTFMSAVPVTISDGNIAHFAEVAAGTAQFWVYQGAAHFGGTAGMLDVNGLTLWTAAAYDPARAVKFYYGTALMGALYGFGDANNVVYLTTEAIAGRSSQTAIISDSPSGQNSTAQLIASQGTASAYLMIRIDSSGNKIAAFRNNSGAAIPVEIGKLNVPNAGELTISAGIVTATGGRHTIDTEGDAATDDLDTINGGTDGDILILNNADSTRDVTYKDATGNLHLSGDFIANGISDTITLINYSGTDWFELSRSLN